VQGPSLPLYGLDIETDTSCGGLDPRQGGIVAAALSTATGSVVFTGEETALLVALDELLGTLAPGVVVTWHGAGFDLPFLAVRAAMAGVPLGLELQLDRGIDVRQPLAGHPGAYRARWGPHTHLDAYQLFRDIGRAVMVSCSLKSMARFFGLEPVEVDRARIHDLNLADLSAYVASDAELTRRLATLRWHAACRHIDAPFLPPEPAAAYATGASYGSDGSDALDASW
jgi:DNA polymerase elongation subunit (family B)